MKYLKKDLHRDYYLKEDLQKHSAKAWQDMSMGKKFRCIITNGVGIICFIMLILSYGVFRSWDSDDGGKSPAQAENVVNEESEEERKKQDAFLIQLQQSMREQTIEKAKKLEIGQKIYTKQANVAICKSFATTKLPIKNGYRIYEIPECLVIDFEHPGNLLGKLIEKKQAIVKDNQGIESEYIFLRIKGSGWFPPSNVLSARERLRIQDNPVFWVEASEVRSQKTTQHEKSGIWFQENISKGNILYLKAAKKNIGKYEIIEVKNIDDHVAYYFPFVEKTILVNLNWDRITDVRHGKITEWKR